MRFIAVTTEHVLEAVLAHLHRTGWKQVDVRKLADAYEAYQRATSRKIYGSVMFPSLTTIRRAIDADIDALAKANVAQRSVSRVWLLPPPRDAVVVRFTLDPLQAPLLAEADKLFPPLTARP